MGKGRKVAGPIAFMPSDGRFLGAKDLQGLPVGPDGLRMSIRVVEVLELPPGEVVNGKKIAKAFWSIIFDRPPHDWLLAPWDSKPKAGPWERSRKEWKIGPEVAGRLAMRLGADASLWSGAVVPIRLEVTSFGRDDVWGVRPVPLPWESDPQKRREAMAKIAAGTYQPPGLPRREEEARLLAMLPKRDDTQPEASTSEPERFDDEPPGDWQGEVPA